MSKRTAGIAFFAMAAFIFSMRHIGAALFAGLIEQSEWPSNVYTLPVGLGIANIVLGVVYLVWGELEELGLISQNAKKSNEPVGLLDDVDEPLEMEQHVEEEEEVEEEAPAGEEDSADDEAESDVHDDAAEETEGEGEAVEKEAADEEDLEEDAQAEELEEDAATEDEDETSEEERAR